MGFKTLGIDERSLAYGANRLLTPSAIRAGQYARTTSIDYYALLPYNNGVNDATNYGRIAWIQHSSCVVGNLWYIFGGYNGAASLGDLWRINLDTYDVDKLTTSGGPPSIRYGAQVVAIGTKIYMWGGNGALKDTWEFDIPTLTWSQLVGDDVPYTSYACGAVTDGTYAYSVCGYVNAAPSKDIYIFDPSTAVGSKWSLLSTEGGTMTPRYHAGVTIHKGKIYIAGGYKTTPWTDSDGVGNGVWSMYEFDIATTTWTRKANLCLQYPYESSTYAYFSAGKNIRYGASLGVSNNKLFLYGGLDSAGTTYLQTGLMYNIATNVWSPTPPLYIPRAYFAMAAYQNRFYIVGGTNSSSATIGNYIECIYNPKRSVYQEFGA